MKKHNHKLGTKGVQHIIRATGYSLKGLKGALAHEEAFRQEIWASAVLMPLALFLGQGGVEKAVLCASLLLVLIVELINSAIEAVVDRIGKENHPLSGMAKDLGSAAVMVSLINVVIVWSLILWDRLME
ncbi:MAG: diacylglycerol kinase [Desulfobacteraceae bacterium]